MFDLSFKNLTPALVLFAASALVHLPANSGTVAGFGGGTEVTQIMNNGELIKVSMDSAQTAVATASAHMTQLEQYRVQLMNAQGVDPNVFISNIRETAKVYKKLKGYSDSVTTLYGSLKNQVENIDENKMAAQMLNLTWDLYLQKTVNEAENGNEVAKKRIEYARDVMEQVDEDYKFVKEQMGEIGGAMGQHQSMKILNNQMNKLVSQNARISAMMARAEADVSKETERLNAKVASTKEYDLMLKRQKAIRNQQLEMMQK